VDIKYCYESCEKGRAFANKALWECESVFDAVTDIYHFIDGCFPECPFKAEIEKTEIPEKYRK
jgi:hypothetical protein